MERINGSTVKDVQENDEGDKPLQYLTSLYSDRNANIERVIEGCVCEGFVDDFHR